MFFQKFGDAFLTMELSRGVLLASATSSMFDFNSDRF